MVIDEVFPNPTVKLVIFQILYPNLFYLENRIGDFQTKIMKEFPESALKIQKVLLQSDAGSKIIISEPEEPRKKVWQFVSPNKIELNITTDSLGLQSTVHKTYNNESVKERFRDIIKFVLDNFFDVTNIPVINRIGLRYIDECPIPQKTNSNFKSYYNTTFALDRFNLKNTEEMLFKALIKKGKYYFRFHEVLEKGSNRLILDYDAFAGKTTPKEYLDVTDELHTIISDEYDKSIKEPVKKYMRTKKKEEK